MTDEYTLRYKTINCVKVWFKVRNTAPPEHVVAAPIDCVSVPGAPLPAGPLIPPAGIPGRGIVERGARRGARSYSFGGFAPGAFGAGAVGGSAFRTAGLAAGILGGFGAIGAGGYAFSRLRHGHNQVESSDLSGPSGSTTTQTTVVVERVSQPPSITGPGLNLGPTDTQILLPLNPGGDTPNQGNTPVPEPATVALLLAGAVMAGVIRRIRN